MATKLITAQMVGINGLPFNAGTLAAEEAAVTGTGGSWALASGASNLNVGGYTHTTGAVTPLTTALAAVNATYYQVTATISYSATAAGTVTIAFGGASISTISATTTAMILTTGTGVLTLTPTTDFNGTVVLSIRQISSSSSVAFSLPVKELLIQDISALKVYCGSVLANTQITHLSTGNIYCSTTPIDTLVSASNSPVSGQMYKVATVYGINTSAYTTALPIAFPMTGILARSISSTTIGGVVCVTEITALATGTKYYTDVTVATIISNTSAVNLTSVTNVASENTQVFATAATIALPPERMMLRVINPSVTIGSTACVTEITILTTGTKYYTSTAASSILV